MNFNLLRMFFQNCWNCSSPTWSAYTFCGHCKQTFEDKVLKLNQRFCFVESFPLYFLANYEYGIEEKLVLSLKRAQCSELNFEFVAGVFIRIMTLEGFTLNNVVLVTPESKHSVEIVKSINKITGLNLTVIILKEHCEVGRVAQKLKKRKERKQKEFVFLGYSVDKTKNFVFVDDVVATGSTAKAVWLALGKPSLFHIWSLTYRPRLARTTFF